jgi:hypothetical protein
LAHLRDLSEEGPHRSPHSVVHVVQTVSRLKYEGGDKEAVLDKVVEVYLRYEVLCLCGGQIDVKTHCISRRRDRSHDIVRSGLLAELSGARTCALD